VNGFNLCLLSLSQKLNVPSDPIRRDRNKSYAIIMIIRRRRRRRRLAVQRTTSGKGAVCRMKRDVIYSENIVSITMALESEVFAVGGTEWLVVEDNKSSCAAHPVSLSSTWWIATRPSIDPSANPDRSGKHAMQRDWYLSGDIKRC